MTREEQLMYCKQCINRKMDMQQGLLCRLSDKKADFDGECSEFVQDETVAIPAEQKEEGMHPSDIKTQLSPEIVAKFKMEQRLLPAIVVGLVVGLIGAILWGAITVATGYQIGYMAIAIGAGVGFSIRKVGKGIDKIFGIWGAAISLFSVLLGNFFSVIAYVSEGFELSVFETLRYLDYAFLPQLMFETFSVMDLFFYGLALYEGYRFSFRVVTEDQIKELLKERVRV